LGRQADERSPQYMEIGTSWHMGPQGLQHFIHLENVNTMFAYSYVESGHLGKMCNFVHLTKMAMAAKKYRVFVTYMLVMYLYLARHYQKISQFDLLLSTEESHTPHATMKITRDD
jgi:hypothetical protein